MSLPRFVDRNGNNYDVVLGCACGYAVAKDNRTKGWTNCPICSKPLKTKRIDYGSEQGIYGHMAKR